VKFKRRQDAQAAISALHEKHTMPGGQQPLICKWANPPKAVPGAAQTPIPNTGMGVNMPNPMSMQMAMMQQMLEQQKQQQLQQMQQLLWNQQQQWGGGGGMAQGMGAMMKPQPPQPPQPAQPPQPPNPYGGAASQYQGFMDSFGYGGGGGGDAWGADAQYKQQQYGQQQFMGSWDQQQQQSQYQVYFISLLFLIFLTTVYGFVGPAATAIPASGPGVYTCVCVCVCVCVLFMRWDQQQHNRSIRRRSVLFLCFSFFSLWVRGTSSNSDLSSGPDRAFWKKKCSLG
jgi:hypothetical protein